MRAFFIFGKKRSLRIKERYEKVIDHFVRHQPDPKTELSYSSPYQLIVAVILSAQCTDKRVNMITPPFFGTFPDAESLSRATHEEVYEIIKSCSYPNNKSKNLIGMAKTLVNEFKGEVPDDVELLQRLPGVGRKSANVIASVVFQKPAMAVDTHVFRVAARLGLTTNAKTPLEAEKQLVRHIPADLVHKAHHWLILHGRYVCQARKPKCKICGVRNWCRYYQRSVKGRG